MTGLLALVADTILLARTVTRQVTNLTTVVALLTLGAIAGQVTVSTARVAGLLAATTTTTTRSAVRPRATEATTIGRALASNVADLTTFIAFCTALIATTTTTALRLSGGRIVTFAREMARLTAAIAGLLLLRTSAFAAHVPVLSTVVANRSSTLGAIASLMTSLAAVVAGTTTRRSILVVTTEIHCGSCS